MSSIPWNGVAFKDIKHEELKEWVLKQARHFEPDSIHFCKWDNDEYVAQCKEAVDRNIFIPLNKDRRPDCYLVRSDPDDTKRVEEFTYICSKTLEEAGPSNQWVDPKIMRNELDGFFKGCMKGRVMYVCAFSMGPVGSDKSQLGVQLTDSLYVVLNKRIMTRTQGVLEELGADGKFVKCVHSVGYPLKDGRKDVVWPCDVSRIRIVHFPETAEIWSFGSGYGGNALLGKKCLALRIASALAQREGWMAEHMLILGITPPGKAKGSADTMYIGGAFPSQCGKTNLAMLQSALPNWSIETIGDDIAWMKFDDSGILKAINPENGFFGVAPGTSYKSNYNAMESIRENTIFTNCALTKDGDIWWYDIEDNWPETIPFCPPSAKEMKDKELTDWKGNKVPVSDDAAELKEAMKNACNNNARFTAAIAQCPSTNNDLVEAVEGVPISAIIFGGRRKNLVPLVYQSLGWNHGTYLGATLTSEFTAAAKGKIGKLVRDPMAMRPFIGYNMATYFKHWLEMGKKTTPEKLPKIFMVNWFRREGGKLEGDFLWEGFGDNMRVLKWIYERVRGDKLDGSGKRLARVTPIGLMPKAEDLDLEGYAGNKDCLSEILSVDRDGWIAELQDPEKEVKAVFPETFKFPDVLPVGTIDYLKMCGEFLPKELWDEYHALRERLVKWEGKEEYK